MQPQTYKLVLNKACNEDWNTMGVIDGGRHCEQCSKDVIDFSSYSKEAIIDFFIANQSKSICGRMRKSQMNAIEIDRSLLDYNISFWKKFLIIFLIVFGYELFGASFVFAQIEETDTLKLEKLKIVDTLKIDTLVSDSMIKNDTVLLDSTAILIREKKKIEDEIEKLEIEVTKIKSERHSFKFDDYKLYDFKLESIICEGMISGFMVLIPNNDLKPIVFGEPENPYLNLDTKVAKKANTQNISSVQNMSFPINPDDKRPEKKDQNDYNLTCILPEEAKEKKKNKI
jgi:hypothetical protein